MLREIFQQLRALFARQSATGMLGSTHRDAELARLEQIKARTTLHGLRTLNAPEGKGLKPKPLAAISQPQSSALIKRTSKVDIDRCAGVQQVSESAKKKSMKELLSIGHDYMGGE